MESILPPREQNSQTFGQDLTLGLSAYSHEGERRNKNFGGCFECPAGELPARSGDSPAEIGAKPGGRAEYKT
jgi:hypothetical protein